MFFGGRGGKSLKTNDKHTWQQSHSHAHTQSHSRAKHWTLGYGCWILQQFLLLLFARLLSVYVCDFYCFNRSYCFSVFFLLFQLRMLLLRMQKWICKILTLSFHHWYHFPSLLLFSVVLTCFLIVLHCVMWPFIVCTIICLWMTDVRFVCLACFVSPKLVYVSLCLDIFQLLTK